MIKIPPPNARARAVVRAVVWTCALGLSGCYDGLSGSDAGAADDGSGDDAGPGEDGGEPGELECSTDPLAMGAALMHRLTRSEYNNTVRDLLGDATAPADVFADDGRVGPFAANTIAPPSSLELEDYMDAAETLAASAVQDLPGLLQCDPAVVGQDDCAGQFITTFGRRAFRRALSAEEHADYVALYEFGRDQEDFTHGINLVVRGLLQSPNFLYRIEVGQPVADRPELMALTGAEIASRLSYFLWKSMPDEPLLAAAEAGELDTPEGIEIQVRRMLETPDGLARAHDAVGEFHVRWLELTELAHLQKDLAVYPDFDGPLTDDMRTETHLLAGHVVLEDDGRLQTLLTAPYTFASPALAEVYGATHPTGAGFERIELDPARRSGILTQPGLMAVLAHPNQTSPVSRGRWVREQLLCQPPPPPPPDVDDTPPVVDPDLPAKERFAQHRDSPTCAGCHMMMDPIGFGFEHYDAVGGWRDSDGNLSVDATGEILGTIDADGEFDGAIELAAKLAQSRQVMDCAVEQWFRFSMGRVERDEDSCAIEALGEKFAAADGDVRELLVGMTTAETFRYRRIPEATEQD